MRSTVEKALQRNVAFSRLKVYGLGLPLQFLPRDAVLSRYMPSSCVCPIETSNLVVSTKSEYEVVCVPQLPIRLS